MTANPTVTLGLAMIMKNEAANLPKSLGPLAGLVDEMVVVDTGSTDGSPQLAAQYGARVLDFKWVDDFSVARNFSLKAATTDFILWFDADNSLTPEGLLVLRRHLERDKKIILWATEVVTPQGDRLWQKRVFPNRPDIYFEGRVHEQLTHPSDYVFVPTEAEILHWGYAETQSARQKGERNLELLLKTPQTLDGDFYWLYQTGRTLFNLRRFEEARVWLGKALNGKNKVVPLVGHTVILLSQVLGRLGFHQEAEECLRRFMTDNQGYGPVYYQLGRILYDVGQTREAGELLEAAILLGTGDKAWGADERIYNFRAAFILGRIWAESGRGRPARQAFYLARDLDPSNPEPSFALAEVALADGEAKEARLHLDRALKLAPGHRRALDLYASLESINH